METQDHKKLKQSGHEGHSGGVHVCKKCGWPFPNPHPNSRHKRSHKKVCGTIEGYRLDDHDAKHKTHLMDGSDGEHISDDEHKTQSGKVLETTISRRSSGGVGSRSSRSTRSEDEVFADAVTDFTDTPAPGEASDGVIQRFYSMQRVTENDLDDIKHAAENASADNLCAPSILLKDNQVQGQTVQKLEGGNDRTEAGILSQDHITSSTTGPALVSALATVGNDNEGETADESKEVLSSNTSELRTSYYETTEEASEDISILRAANEKILGPVSGGGLEKSTGMKTTFSENNAESQVVDDPGNFFSLENPTEVIDPANISSSKLNDVMEDYGSKTGANEDAYILAISDALPLDKNHEIVVEEVDHKRGKFNTLKAPDSATETVEYGILCAAEEVCSGIDLSETGDDGKKVYSEDDAFRSVNAVENKLNQDVGQKSLSEQNVVEEPGQLLDVEASNAVINEFSSDVTFGFKTENLEDKKVGCAEEPKPIVSSENMFAEGASSNTVDNPDFTSNEAANTSNSTTYNVEHVVLQKIDNSEMSGKELSGSLLLAEHAINDIPPQVKGLSNIHDSSDTDKDGNTGVIQTLLDGNEMRNGGNEAVIAETALGGLSISGSRDGIHDPLELGRISGHDESDKMVDSGEVMVGRSLPMVESTDGSSGVTECMGGDGPGATLKTGDVPGSITKVIPSDALEVCEDAQCSSQSSAAVNGSCTKKFAEEASGVVESDRIVKQHVAVTIADVLPDSNSQTDSLEGNWGSVSVMSALSDTAPAIDTPASNHLQSSAAENIGSLDLKPVMESQHYESKLTVEPHVGIGKMEGVSEIQTLEEQKEKGLALQTSWSSSVAHLENTPQGVKRNEEIIAKVTNWSAEKQHIPLKTLLGEATARSRAESPIHTQLNPKADEIPIANNGYSETENVILSSNNPTSEDFKEEMGKEWNSPARYPVNIKTEKRKAKSRPYWAPFLCCSSVNAR